MLDKIISYSFYFLFFLTPLFWTSLNHELFEFNKMFLTYGFTVIIVGTWLLKSINHKELVIRRTPLDIPLLLFLGANILSTIFSIDPHTSIWGYYSRQNGGLLSLIAYLLLYFAFVSNMDKAKVATTLKFAFVSGVIISVWGILEHFGVSPSCVILRGELNASCWIQDVQARVFATLGQPNWMAGYLAMLIFPALYFFLTSKTLFSHTTYYILLTTYYSAFTFTYSRGPTLGLIGGFAIFLFLSSRRMAGSNKLSINWIPAFAGMTKAVLIILLSFLLINLLFGSAITSFRLVSKFAPPPRPTISLPTAAGGGTQLETGGTESGQIRFIVWRGALDIFKNYPIFGSGVETFAFSYYQFRPTSHNLTSEWDFLYNKAHNEYLNYLATTGIVGFSAYSIIIITFIIFILKKRRPESLLIYALLASYVSYLIYNFFLFSVVIIALFFYLFPALSFVGIDSLKPLKVFTIKYILIPRIIVIFAIFYLLFNIFQFWYADTLFSKGEKASDLGNPGRAYNLLTDASDLNKGEPLYRSELAFAAAAAAEALIEVDASLSATLKEKSIDETERVLAQNPKNVSYLRSAIRTYAQLAGLDKKFLADTLKIIDQAIILAPTDPKLYYNKALILEQMGKNKEAKEVLEKTLNLKPDYLEAKEELKELEK